MLPPSFRLCASRSTSSGVPCRKSRLKRSPGLVSAGTMAPLVVNDWLCALNVPSTTDGNRVTYPSSFAATWSSETVLRNPSRPGRRAAVSHVISELCGWRPDCSSWEKPENNV